VLRPELGAVLCPDRFLSEINDTANLQHPHLLPLFDSGEVDGLLFYVMPFVEGESLRARLDRERQLPVDDSVRIALAIASYSGFVFVTSPLRQSASARLLGMTNWPLALPGRRRN
jgi:serine/threonine protein kinase